MQFTLPYFTFGEDANHRQHATLEPTARELHCTAHWGGPTAHIMQLAICQNPRAPNSKTKKLENTKIKVNIHQIRSNWSGNFQSVTKIKS